MLYPIKYVILYCIRSLFRNSVASTILGEPKLNLQTAAARSGTTGRRERGTPRTDWSADRWPGGCATCSTRSTRWTGRWTASTCRCSTACYRQPTPATRPKTPRRRRRRRPIYRSARPCRWGAACPNRTPASGWGLTEWAAARKVDGPSGRPCPPNHRTRAARIDDNNVVVVIVCRRRSRFLPTISITIRWKK